MPQVDPPAEPAALSPHEARALFRAGLRVPTSGYCAGRTQANLIALPRDLAFDFLLFTQRNPKSCPVLDVAEEGETGATILDGDLRTDLPAYRLYRHGELVEELADARDAWRSDLCSGRAALHRRPRSWRPHRSSRSATRRGTWPSRMPATPPTSSPDVRRSLGGAQSFSP